MENIRKHRDKFMVAAMAVVLLVFIGYQLGTKEGEIKQLKVFSVVSGSMRPNIQEGSAVVSQKNMWGYSVVDVITYRRGEQWVTHRVVEVKDTGGAVSYVTRGDANENADQGEVTKDRIWGKVVAVIPYWGYLGQKMNDRKWLVFLIVVPATIVIWEEMKKVVGYVCGRKEASNDNVIWVVMPVLIGSLVSTSVSGAWLSDLEVSNNNQVTATAPTAIPPTGEARLVINEVMPNPISGEKEWVELYNSGTVSVSTVGWKIKDDDGNVLSADVGNVLAGEHKLFEFSEATFLNNNGDVIFLVDGGSLEQDSTTYAGSYGDNESWGRSTDGGNTWKKCAGLSKNTSNNGVCL